MFKEGFGVLSVKPIARSPKKKRCQCACLIKTTTVADGTCATTDPCRVSSPALDTSTPPQRHDIAFKCDHSCPEHLPKHSVSHGAESMSPKFTIPEDGMRVNSGMLVDDLLARSSIPDENMQATRGLGFVNTLVESSPVELLTTPFSTSVVNGSETVAMSASDKNITSVRNTIVADKNVETRRQITVEMSTSDTNLESVRPATSEMSASEKKTLLLRPLITNQMEPYLTSEVNKPNTPVQMSEIDHQDTSVITLTVDETNMLVSNEMVDKSCRHDEGLEISKATDKERSMTDSAGTRKHAIIPDPKCSSDCDITSVVGSPVLGLHLMSIQANENSLIRYLTDVSWAPPKEHATQLISSCIETDPGSPSKSRSAVKYTKSLLRPMTKSKVKSKRKKIRDNKVLKQLVKKAPPTTPTARLADTCSDTVIPSAHHQSAGSLFTGETSITEPPYDAQHASTESRNEVRIKSEPANNDEFTSTVFGNKVGINPEPLDDAEYASTESRNEVRIKSEPANNDEFASAVFGNKVGINPEQLDDAEYASTEYQSKDQFTKPTESHNPCPRSMNRFTTVTPLIDGATRKRKHTFETLAGIRMSNVTCEKSGDSQQLQQPLEQIESQPISAVVTTLERDSSLPIKIASVFSLNSHSHNMSIQDIVNVHEQDVACKGIKFPDGTKSEIRSANSNDKNFNTIKFSEELKSDSCLKSPCRVVLDKIQLKNGRMEVSKCTKMCRQGFLSGKRKYCISHKQLMVKEGASHMPYLPQMRMETGSNSPSLDSSSTSHSALPAIFRVSATDRMIGTNGNVPPVMTVLPPDADARALEQPSVATKFYMINVQGRNIRMPVRLNDPRIVSYRQSLNRPMIRHFPGMQLPKVSSEHTLANSSHVPNLSIKTEPNSQKHGIQSATKFRKSVTKADAHAAEKLVKSIRLAYVPELEKYIVKKIDGQVRRNTLYKIAAKTYGTLTRASSK